MADEAPVITPQPTGTPPAPVNQDGQAEDDWFVEAQKEKGFKEKKEVWHSYKEAEKKISEQGIQLGKAEEFQNDVKPILDIIWSDPELLEKVRSKATGKQPEPDKKEDKKEETPPPVDITARNVLRSQIASEFEKDNGIDKLDEATKKEVRATIGKAMSRWVRPGEQLPVENLREIFDDSLTLAKSKDSKLNKLMGDIAAGNMDGAFSSMPSGGGNRDDIQLTPEEEKVASHMPGGIEKYKAGKKKLLNK